MLELEIPTIYAYVANGLNLVRSEFKPDHQLLISRVTGSGDKTHSPINLTTSIQKPFHDPYWGQTRERLNTEKTRPSNLVRMKSFNVLYNQTLSLLFPNHIIKGLFVSRITRKIAGTSVFLAFNE